MHVLYLSPGQNKTTKNSFGKIQEIRIWPEFYVMCESPMLLDVTVVVL